MRDITIVITILAALGGVLFAVAARLSAALVRSRAHRLPTRIALRMEEEWLGELNAIASRPGKLAFAIALTLTRRRAFVVPGEDSMTEFHDRPAGRLAVFNGRKTLLVLTTLLFAIAAYGTSFLLPVRYASETLIYVVPQAVSKEYVRGLIEESPEERSRSILQSVMSRTSFFLILRSFPELKIGRETWSMGRMIEELRKDITVEFSPSTEGANLTYFRMRYLGTDPALAQRVMSQLTTFFIEQDNKTRETRLLGTSDFLRGQLEVIAKRLIEKQKQLARGRAEHGPEAILAMDYELLKSTYASVFAKYEEAQMSIAMEKQQRGGGFAVVDPANMGTPVVPNRLAIAGIGAFAGFVLGGMAVVGLGRRHRRALA
jgi:uncharacterized protein involved in exopolysaccharide biosynthesis